MGLPLGQVLQFGAGQLPGLLQAGAGGLNFVGDMITRPLDILKNLAVAWGTQVGTEKETSKFQEGAFNDLWNARQDYTDSVGDADRLWNEQSMAAHDQTGLLKKQYQTTADEAKRQGQKIVDSTGEARTRFRSYADTIAQKIAGFEDMADTVRAETVGRINDNISFARNTFSDIISRADDVMSLVRTNNAERVGAITGGMVRDTETTISKYVQEQRKLGVDERDIQHEVTRMREGVQGRVAGVLGQSTAAVNDLLAITGTNLTNVIKDAAATTGSLVRDAVTQFMQAGEANVNARIAGVAARGDLAKSEAGAEATFAGIELGAYSFMTGAQERADQRVTDVVTNNIAIQNAITEQRAALRIQKGTQLAALDQQTSTVRQVAMNNIIQSMYFGGQIMAGTTIGFPPVASYMAPATSAMQSGVNSWMNYRAAQQAPSGGSDGSAWGSAAIVGASNLGSAWLGAPKAG